MKQAIRFWRKVILLLMLAVLINCKGTTQNDTNCFYKSGKIKYLDSLYCKDDYKVICGEPLTEKYGQVVSVKVIYQLENHKLYYAESKKYPLHYEFCTEVLNYYNGLAYFNNVNYTNTKYRQFFLGNLNYYSALDIYTLEFFNGDAITAEQIKLMYTTIQKTAPAISKQLKLLVNTPELELKILKLPGIPTISPDEIYRNQKYQSLYKGEVYGYLRFVDKADFEAFVFNKHDIVVTNTIPNVLPVVAGVITVPFQTPLCHISVLCNNRGTPNAAYRLAFTDSNLMRLKNKLVRFEVNSDSMRVTDATDDTKRILDEWQKKDFQKQIKLAYDIKSSGLIDVKKLNSRDANLVGGKAANFGELEKVELPNHQKLPLPEGAFAIPFYYYVNHIKTNGIQASIDSLLNNKALYNNTTLLNATLKRIQKAILKSKVDPILVKMIKSKIGNNGLPFDTYRFRSSTNAEDIKGFNGAGLYASKSVIKGDTTKTIEKAIRQVWASLWGERAFAERAYFNFDQQTVFMGILVHRAFGDELANGVAVTKHLYRPGYPSYTINVQKGEISVVAPDDTTTCDQMIIGLGAIVDDDKYNIEYISRSSISKGKAILTSKQLEDLVDYLTAIKLHFYYLQNRSGLIQDDFDDFAMDIEFKVDKYSNKIYIKQARNY